MARRTAYKSLNLSVLAACLASALLACGSSDPEPGPGAAGASEGSAGAAVAGGGAAGSTNPGAGAPNAGSSPGGSAGAAAGSGGTSAGAGGTAGSGAGAGSGGTGGKAGTAGAAGTGGSGGTSARVTGSIVPLYTYPSDSSWNAIIAAKQAHPAVQVIAIVNPDSGPGASADATFTSGIAKLVAAGIVPIGYVSTNYTKRGQPAVKGDVDAWRSFYPKVQGIFFDEQSVQPGDEAFYSTVSSYTKSKGLTLTVGNPGTGVPDSYLGTVDIMLCYESAGVPTAASLKKYAAHRSEFAIIPYKASFDASYVKSVLDSVAYVYITNDDLPNPWDTLPPYFDSLIGALAP